MVLEIAQIDVKPGMEAEFEAGVAKAVPLFRRAKGCSAMTLQRSVEKPARYRVFVTWATLENHTVDFRGSADFAEWGLSRALGWRDHRAAPRGLMSGELPTFPHAPGKPP